MIQHVRYAFRYLAKKPLLNLLNALVMAIGISFSVLLFSFTNALLFKPLPFSNSENLIQISASHGTGHTEMLNAQDYAMLKEKAHTLANLSSYQPLKVHLTGFDGATRYDAAAIEPNLFALTHTQPFLGREFSAGDNDQVVIIGYNLWQKQYAGDEHIINKRVLISGKHYTIVGVMPHGYSFPYTEEIWIPLTASSNQITNNDANPRFVLAHIKNGFSITHVRQELSRLVREQEIRHADTHKGLSAAADYVSSLQIQESKPVIISLQVISLLILLMAVINIISLCITRACELKKESAIRCALGARGILCTSQPIYENIILCLLGGVIALFLLSLSLKAIQPIITSVNYFSPHSGRAVEMEFDKHTFLIFTLFWLISIVIMTLVSAWHVSQKSLAEIINQPTHLSTHKSRNQLNSVLIFIKLLVAACVLTLSGGLLLVNAKNINADYGADTKDIIAGKVYLADPKYRAPDEKVTLLNELQARLENNFGIGNVMIFSELPGEPTLPTLIEMENKTTYTGNNEPRVNLIVTTADSLKNLKVILKDGDYFQLSDNNSTTTNRHTEVLNTTDVVVTEDFVSRYLHNQPCLGARFRVVDSSAPLSPWLTIRGVIKNTIHGAAIEEKKRYPAVYIPYPLWPKAQMTIAVRTAINHEKAAIDLREIVSRIDSQLPIVDIKPYQHILTSMFEPLMLCVRIFFLFGIITSIFAVLSLYGLMNNMLTQNAQIISLKQALGASDQIVRKELLSPLVTHYLCATILGICVALCVALLDFTVLPLHMLDALSIGVCVLVVHGICITLASRLPVEKIMCIEPFERLRHE